MSLLLCLTSCVAAQWPMEDGAPLGSEHSATRRLSCESVATRRRGTSASDLRRSSSRPGQLRPSYSLPPGPAPSVELSELPSQTADAGKAALELQRLREENHALLARVASLTELSNSQCGSHSCVSTAARASESADQVGAAAAAGGHESEQSSDSEPAQEVNDSATTAAAPFCVSGAGTWRMLAA